VAEAKAQNAEAEARHRALLIEQMKFTIAKLRHEKFGPSSERGALLEQLELALADMEEDASEAEAKAQMAAAATVYAKVQVQAFERRKPARRPLPEHLPRERIVYPAPSACPCCGGTLHKLGEDVTETLELIPRRWKVIQHVREKFSCRSCESITQPPAPSHPIARGRAGPGCSRTCCFPSTACICRSTARAQPSRAKASSSTSRRWPIGSAPALQH
jgi:transposase